MRQRILKFLIVACFLGGLATAWPLLAQTATDAVQNEKLRTLEDRVAVHAQNIADLDSKMNYTLGGIAGMYALLGVIGIFNLRLIGKK